MARSLITEVSDDLQSDSGAVLFSFVQGEQLEFPITLPFIENVSLDYNFEAVLLEGLNTGDERPSTIRPGGIQTTLTVYRPTFRSYWGGANEYFYDDVVLYNGLYYISLATSLGHTSAVAPDIDTVYWQEYIPNKVYVQFPSSLSMDWSNTIAPTPTSNIYGFFELRVTEPSSVRYRRTWKPVRGLVEFLFSPTGLVADAP